MLHLRGHGIKRRVAVNFVLGGIKQSVFIGGIAGVEIGGSNHPDANSFITTSINVAGIFYGHPGIDSMQTTNVFMGKAVLAPNKNFPEWPLVHSAKKIANGR